MKNKENKDPEKQGETEKFPGYPHYSSSEDIYGQMKEEADLDPEDPTREKTVNDDPDAPNEKDFNEAMTGDDLDIPTPEEESTKPGEGPEDEENDYYSLGGDEHNNLEENQGQDSV